MNQSVARLSEKLPANIAIWVGGSCEFDPRAFSGGRKIEKITTLHEFENQLRALIRAEAKPGQRAGRS
jgi:hypothetical protein